MKPCIAIFLLAAPALRAATPSEPFCPDLMPVYSALSGTGAGSSLVGKELAANLTIKHASAKWVVFSDAYLAVDKETKYQIGKWSFKPEVIESVIGAENAKCNVRLLITGANANDPKMPFVEAEILAIRLEEKR